jgi:hypothetical protein
MHIGMTKRFLKIGFFFVLIVFFGFVGNSKSSAQTDISNVILTGNVARSSKENISNLPIETYFGQPQYNSWQEQLNALNITVYPEDIVSTFPDANFGIGSVIRITRATPVTIIDGSNKILVRTWAQDVQDVLNEQNIELAQDDTISPALSTSILPNQTITITRVEISQVIEKEPIDFNVVRKDDPTLDQGKIRITQTGAKGELAKTYQVRRENQVETDRQLISSEVVNKPIDQIVLIGTKPVITVACHYNSLVIDAASQYNLNPNDLCKRMIAESNGNPNSDGGRYKGLFQYEQGLWNSLSVKAGFSGASIWDAKAQIYTTAWAWSHGYRGRWPS